MERLQIPVKTLRLFILLSILGVGTSMAGDALGGFSKNFPVSVVMFFFFLGCLALGMFHRLYRLTAHLFTLTVLILISLNFLLGNGIHDPASPVYLVVILIAALFLGKRGALVYTVLSLGASSLVIVTEVLGLVQSPYSSTWGTLVTFAVVIGLGGILVWLILDQLEKAWAGEREAADQVRVLNASLENRVAERTRALTEAHERLRQNERYASLGWVASNLIHEINSPLGALVSGTSSITQTLDRFQESFGRMALSGTPADLEVFQALTAGPPLPGAPAPRKIQAAWGARLGALGVSQSQDLAECLSGIAPEAVESLLQMLETRGSPRMVGSAVRAAEEFLVLGRLSALVDEAAGRVQRIVEALRTYVELPGESELFTRFSLRESIVSALDVLQGGGPTAFGVDLDCPAGLVHGQRERLFLVWAHILKEAFQTMAPGELLRVRCVLTPGDPDWVVEFTDPGTMGDTWSTARLDQDREGIRKTAVRHGGSAEFSAGPGFRRVRLTLPAGEPEPT